MKTKTFLLFSLLVCLNSISQDSLLPVFEMRDTSSTVIKDEYFEMLENKNGQLAFPDITGSTKFHPNNTKEKGMGYDGVKDYWVRWRMKNLTGQTQEIIFSSSRYNFKRDYYVIRDSGAVEHTRTGWGFPLSQRDTFRTRNGILIKINDGETITVYARVRLYEYDFFNEYNLSFIYKDRYFNEQYINEKLYRGDTRATFIAGLLVLGFILSIFYYRVARDKVYLYYALVLLLEGIWFLSNNTYLFFKESPELAPWFDNFFTFGLFFLCVTQFARHFLKTFKYYPKWDRVLVVLALAAFLFQFVKKYWDLHLPYSWRGIPSLVFAILLISLMLSLVISFFLPKKESDRYTNLAIIGALPVFCIWTFVYGITNIADVVTSRTGAAPPAWVVYIDTYDNVIEMFCIAWFAFIFIWILTQQYAVLRKKLNQQALEREKEKNEMMVRQKIELEEQVEERTAELKKTINDLQNTQQQLIQTEKMASLGELTAGIAHEIQNPLNFVNNFSDVNSELIAEMKEELKKGNFDAASKIADDISENEQKIIFHGKRADAIVKGMLQHSRTNSGQKEPVDINALCDEYLRLAYHGLRAKDKTFNATTKTEFDNSIGKLNINPQDIGRVILNLINNAFYAVDEKKKQNGNGYAPTVSVSTRKLNARPDDPVGRGKVEIGVKDNGVGISQKVLDKIFQPFFTTKPTGQGTGLGLSLAYDIITKGHGGELKVETSEGEGTVFCIILNS